MADNLIGRCVKTKLGIIFHTKFKSSQLSLLHMVNVWSILTINYCLPCGLTTTCLEFVKDFMKQNKAGSFYLCGCLGIEKSFSMEKEGLPWVEIMYVNCTSLTENIYILKGRKALLQLNEEKPIVLYEGCLLMIHGRVEEKHASGQCFEIRAR
ncbi:unnamed protein product [Brassica oleracea]